MKMINLSNDIIRVIFLSSLALLLETSAAYQCGWQAGYALCKPGLCCSIFGWCGTLGTYCKPRFCQSQCPSSNSALPPPRIFSNISSIITPSLFDEMLPNRDHPSCPARGFYTYEAFIAATIRFPSFGGTGTTQTRKREIAAFFAQTSYATTGRWDGTPGGKYSWGYCFNKELSPTGDNCISSQEWPCAPGKRYYGRAPFQLTYNYNYGPAGKALGLDLLANPDLVATNATVAFETALWLWMTPQDQKPSCHDVIVGTWHPVFPNDIHRVKRHPGFGSTTNEINGFREGGRGSRGERVTHRSGFFERYCRLLDVSSGDDLDYDNSSLFDISPYESQI